MSLGRDSGLRVFYLPVVSQGQQPALWDLMLFRHGFLDGDASENLDHFECHPSYPGNNLGPITLPALRNLGDGPREQR